jgi:hypothetical protein
MRYVLIGGQKRKENPSTFILPNPTDYINQQETCDQFGLFATIQLAEYLVIIMICFVTIFILLFKPPNQIK